MSILNLSQVSKSFLEQTVLDQINLSLNLGDCLALIGNNGSGKTTLLKLIAGIIQPDSGLINFAPNLKISYLSQNINEDQFLDYSVLKASPIALIREELRSIENLLQYKHDAGLLALYQKKLEEFEAADGYFYEDRFKEELAKIGLDASIAKRSLKTLSGGERMRAALAQISLDQPDLLLLDEPTNHLDFAGIDWLINYLQAKKQTCIVISHDRYFLNQCTNKTFHLLYQQGELYKGNYDDFLKQRASNLLFLEKRIKAVEKEAIRQAEVAQTMLSHRKMTMYHERTRLALARQKDLALLKSELVYEQDRLKINFQADTRDRSSKRRLILQIKDLNIHYEHCLLENFSAQVLEQDKIIIVGPNACGKTSLIKAIKQLHPAIWQKPDLKIAFLDQIVEFEQPDLTIFAYFEQEQGQMLEKERRAYLASYGFSYADLKKKLKDLSGGEKTKVFLANLLAQRIDLLILDEPTNHLDIQSREILEAALSNFQASLIAISHDRYFIEKLEAEIWGFQASQIKSYESYSAYLQASTKPRQQEELSKEAKAKPSLTKEIWTQEELALRPSLARINKIAQTRQAERRFLALAKEESKDLELEIDAKEEQIKALESYFESAYQAASFDQTDFLAKQAEYQEAQVFLDQLSNLYFKLAELLC